MIRTFLLIFLTCGSLFSVAQAQQIEKMVIVETSQGTFRINLRPETSRNVAQFKKLIDNKFYNGVVFHLVIPGSVVQTGDPTGTGRGGSTLRNLPLEPSGSAFPRGTVAMTRLKQDENSANSQFFILLKGAPHLKGVYTVVGDVYDGMGVLDKIRFNDTIIKMEILR